MGTSNEVRMSFGQEIMAFSNIISPNSDELSERVRVKKQVACALSDLATGNASLKNCQLIPFGSDAAGLAIFCSDIDYIVTGYPLGTGKAKQKKKEQQQFWGKLEATLRKSMSVEPTTGKGASYSMLKCCSGRVSIDLMPKSSDAPLKALEYMQTAVSEVPPLRPLFLIFKAFVKYEGLGTQVAGGLGGWCLFLMVQAFLQKDEIRRREAQETGLIPISHLLLGLFQCYMHPDAYGIWQADPGSGEGFSRKKLPKKVKLEAPPISVVDPITRQNAAYNCKHLHMFTDACARAADILEEAASCGQVQGSLLAKILPMDDIIARRPPPPPLVAPSLAAMYLSGPPAQEWPKNKRPRHN